ncbi:MAG: nucleotidyltransferase family protein [Gammaproteobacteria bacterium]|nr:nucleotidyltransferase family protein [Gammaproteobacteria bacterium]
MEKDKVIRTRMGISPKEIVAFCKRRQITELALFGSVLRDDFGPNSDIDMLVKFGPDAKPSFLTLDQMEEELGKMLGRKVDLLTRRSVEQSPNWIRRENILGSAKTIYAA